MTIETYFPPISDIHNIRIENLTISCLGENLLEEADLLFGKPQTGTTLFQTSAFAPENNLLKARFTGLELANNETYTLNFNFRLKSDVIAGAVVHCGIDNVKLTNSDTNEVIYNDMKTSGWVAVANNEPLVIFYTGKSGDSN